MSDDEESKISLPSAKEILPIAKRNHTLLGNKLLQTLGEVIDDEA